MKFSAKTELAMPQEAAFDKLTDVDRLSALGVERGIEVSQTAGEGVEAGAAWRAEFLARRKTRALEITAQEVTPPESVTIDAKGEFLSFHVVMAVKKKSKKASTLNVAVEAKGENLQGRLLVQSAKLARKRIASAFSERLDKFAEMLCE